MGGIFVNDGNISGHMSHLHENLELTLSELKGILVSVTNGSISGTEKTDGQNLYVSYDVENNEPRAARNKTMLRNGGVNAHQLAEKFAGRGLVEQTFNEAFTAFSEAVSCLTEDEKKSVFGPNANVFYNVEIQDPRNKNVILYDNPTLNFHQLGHFIINHNDNSITTNSVDKFFGKLQEHMPKMSQRLKCGSHRITINPTKTLPIMESFQRDELFTPIEKEFLLAGLGDGNTIGELAEAKVRRMIIDNNITNPAAVEAMVQRFVYGIKNGESSLTRMKKNLNNPEGLSEFVKHADKVFLSEAVSGIEQSIHNFAVEALRGFESSFIADRDNEVARLKASVQAALDEVSRTPELQESLAKHLAKLGSAEGINSPTEGFVFCVEGRIYKLTGHFAPMNQILGSLREDYKKGNKNMNKEKTIAVVPGGFKPPHRGHMEMIAEYAKNVDEVIVLISPLSRDTPNGTEITAEQSQRLFSLYNEALGLSNVQYRITEINSPVQAAYDFLGNAPSGTTLVFGVSSKDGGRDEERFAAHRLQSAAPEGVTIQENFFSPISEGVSATRFREAIMQGADLSEFVPSGVNLSEVEQILGKLLTEDSSESSLDEMAAMAGGAVATAAGPFGATGKAKKKKAHYPTIYEDMDENYYISREKIMKEMQLREAIRTALQESKTKEETLREFIRTALTEAKQSEEPVYGSTGINKLRDLLRNIIPTIKDSYKDLTTSPKQRASLVNNFFAGIENLLATIDTLEASAEEPGLQDGDADLEEEIKVKVRHLDPAKIDLGLDDETPEEPEVDDRSEEEILITGEDGMLPTDPDELTGLRAAAGLLKKVKTQIGDAYEELASPKDREDFEKFILPNIKSHLDEFESELTNAPDVEVENPEGSKTTGELFEDQIELSEYLLRFLARK